MARRVLIFGRWSAAAGLLYLVLFFLTPLGQVLFRSFGPAQGLSTYYVRILTTPVYQKVFWNTVEIGVIVSLVVLILSYPLCYFLLTTGSTRRRYLLALVVSPLWISILVRSFAWIGVLQRKGLVNRVLESIGLVDAPLDLVYNRFGVVIGMVYVLLPYCVLVLFGTLRTIDHHLLSVAETLGATRLRAFLTIFVPLSVPGAASALVLVFVLAFGYFITPALLGGPSETMMSMVIEDQVNDVLDLGLASALSVCLLATVVLVMLGVLTLASVRKSISAGLR